MTVDKDKLSKATKQATQPGPWTAIRNPTTNEWRVVDANGFWVCDVGEDPHQARFIAAAHPQAVEAVLGEIEMLSKAGRDLVGEMETITRALNDAGWPSSPIGTTDRAVAALATIGRLREALRTANERLKRAGCLPIEVSP